jgi:hypothetical protein
LVSATPALLEFGGTRHVLAILPRDSSDACTSPAFSTALGSTATCIVGSDNNLTLCVEAGQLSAPHLAAALVEHRRDRVEFAGRVHSRTDVEWTPLIETTAAEPVGWPDMSAGSTMPHDATCKTLVM